MGDRLPAAGETEIPRLTNSLNEILVQTVYQSTLSDTKRFGGMKAEYYGPSKAFTEMGGFLGRYSPETGSSINDYRNSLLLQLIVYRQINGCTESGIRNDYRNLISQQLDCLL
ncbi:hypothetical protein D3C74_413330 [compost metagenome]